MIARRYESIGIKQVVRLEWLDKVSHLLLSGLNSKAIRQELHEYLTEEKGSGVKSERGRTSRTQVVNMLMKVWASPDLELIRLRDSSLEILRENSKMSLPVHWSMISSVYPFWYNVARQTGRLLLLQDKVTQVQITNRLKEQYGDRETVSRYARYVIRSFVAWGVLRDSESKGCYEKSAPIAIPDYRIAIQMFESALLATPEAKGALGLIFNNPAFFPFRLSMMTGDFISQHSDHITVVRYGLDDEMLELKYRKK